MTVQIPKSKTEAYELMTDIMRGKYDSDALVKFLGETKVSSISDEILSAYLEAVVDSGLYSVNTHTFDRPILDIAGTGGDGKNTVNISTLATLLCASTGLVKVAKYGNRAASSICGSMDVLEGLGLEIELSEQDILHQLRTIGFVPLYARVIYPGAKFVAEARQRIGRPTIFNLFFPLARPIIGNPRFVFGCATQAQLNTVERLYSKQHSVRCLLVHGLDGTDEVSIAQRGLTKYALVDNGCTHRGVLNCKEVFDVAPVDLRRLQVTSKNEAVSLMQTALNPQYHDARSEAVRQAGMINAALALFIAVDEGNREIRDAKKYISVLEDAVFSGKAIELVEALRLERSYGVL